MNPDTQQQMHDALSRVQSTTGLLISPDRWAHWRVTWATPGVIGGIDQTVTCLATDGNVAWFRASTTVDGATYFLGHVHRFTWTHDGIDVVGCPPSLFAKDKEKRAFKPKVKRETEKQRLARVLAEI